MAPIVSRGHTLIYNSNRLVPARTQLYTQTFIRRRTTNNTTLIEGNKKNDNNKVTFMQCPSKCTVPNSRATCFHTPCQIRNIWHGLVRNQSSFQFELLFSSGQLKPYFTLQYSRIHLTGDNAATIDA